jgi:hypothetical protein
MQLVEDPDGDVLGSGIFQPCYFIENLMVE